jgi:TorA maturation chaperone TorD
MAEEGTGSRALEAEDEARAQWYALVSRLFYAPPEAMLLQGLAQPQEEEDPAEASPLLGAWTALKALSEKATPEALREEFDALFVGAGKAAVTPYTSAYAAPYAPDRHLLALRDQLSAWGLARREQVFEVEDHISAVCDVMRWLIENGRSLEEQRAFFATFVEPGGALFCDAIDGSANAVYYRAAGLLTRAFMQVEKDAFDLHTATR